MYRGLNQQFFNWLLKWLNLWFQLRAFIDGNSSGNNRARHSACATKSLLGTNKYIWHILKETKSRQLYKILIDQIKAVRLVRIMWLWVQRRPEHSEPCTAIQNKLYMYKVMYWNNPAPKTKKIMATRRCDKTRGKDKLLFKVSMLT